MTNSTTTPQSTPPPSPTPSVPVPVPHSRWARIWSAAQFVLALAITLVFLAYLLMPKSVPHSTDSAGRLPAANKEIVQVIGPSRLRIQTGSPLDRKLEIVTAHL